MDTEFQKRYADYARASVLASQAAHVAALEAVRNLDSNNGQVLSQPQTRPEKVESKKSKIEFEINEDVIKFYEQSLIYKREKSRLKIHR